MTDNTVRETLEHGTIHHILLHKNKNTNEQEVENTTKESYFLVSCRLSFHDLVDKAIGVL